jgi:predicted PurR-regulated permease PerM
MLGIDPTAARSARAQATVYVAALLLICLVFLIRHTLLVFAIAFMFAYLLYPIVDGIDRRVSHKTHTAAVSLPFALMLVALTGFGLIIKNPVRSEAARLIQQTTSPGFKERLADWKPLDFPIGEHIVENYAQILGFAPQLGKGLHLAARDLANAFIIPILSFFMLKDGRRIRDSVLEIFNVRRQAADSILADAHALMLRYMRGLLFLCLATLVCFSVALSLMQVHYSILLALIASPLEFVPVVGPLTAAVTIIGVSAFNKYPHIPALIAFLILYRLFQDYVLSPYLMRKSVKLHPLLVVFGVFAGGDIGGVAGIFLSVPVLALIRLVYYESRKCRVVARNPGLSA